MSGVTGRSKIGGKSLFAAPPTAPPQGAHREPSGTDQPRAVGEPGAGIEEGEPTGRGRLMDGAGGAATGLRADRPDKRPGTQRRRRGPGRRREVTVRLDDVEWELLATAAGIEGTALAAYMALAAVGVARGEVTPIPSSTAELLRELADARRQVQRFGVLVNQAVAKLQATGEPAPALGDAVAICARAVSRLDEAVVRVSSPS